MSEVDKEWESIQVKDLVTKLERYQVKCDTLTAENIELNERVEKETIDHQDIVKYLDAQLESRATEVKNLQIQVIDLQTCADRSKDEYELQLSSLTDKTSDTIEQLTEKNRILNKSLNDLEEFRKKKDEIEAYIQKLKQTIEDNKKQYHDSVSEMERKAVQDRDRLKKEMLLKVNEVVANFRKISDKQMAETTKRTIRENITINSQLSKMSKKTVDLIQENDQLTEKLQAAHQKIEILQQCEKDMARKNKANEKISSMLVEKAKVHEEENARIRAEREREEMEWENRLSEQRRELSNEIHKLEYELEKDKEKFMRYDQEQEDIKKEKRVLISQLSEATGFIMRAFQEAKAEVYEERRKVNDQDSYVGEVLVNHGHMTAGQSDSLSNGVNENTPQGDVQQPTIENMSKEERKNVLEHLLRRMRFYDISRGINSYMGEEPKKETKADPFSTVSDKLDFGSVLPKPIIRYPKPMVIPKRSIASQTESKAQQLFFADNLVPITHQLSSGRKKTLKPLSSLRSTRQTPLS